MLFTLSAFGIMGIEAVDIFFEIKSSNKSKAKNIDKTSEKSTTENWVSFFNRIRPEVHEATLIDFHANDNINSVNMQP